MGKLFGGSKSKSQSQQTSSSLAHNQAYPFINSAYGGIASGTGKTVSAIDALLGMGDATEVKGAFDDYLGSTGFNFQLDQGSKAITGNAAAKGLLKSGATLKGLTQYGQKLGSSYFQQYLDQLFNRAQQGFTAGQMITNAGQTSAAQSQGTSQSYSKTSPNIIGTLASLGSAAAAGG